MTLKLKLKKQHDTFFIPQRVSASVHVSSSSVKDRSGGVKGITNKRFIKGKKYTILSLINSSTTGYF